MNYDYGILSDDGIGTRFAPPREGRKKADAPVARARPPVAHLSVQSVHLPQFASSLHPPPEPPLASGTEQSEHPPWQDADGVAFVAAPPPVARSSMIPS